MSRKKKNEYICFKCGSEMNVADENYLLVCSGCGTSFYLDDWDFEYEQWEEQQEIESGFYDDEEDDDELDEPECCRACGGPWPDCESSCKIFDD